MIEPNRNSVISGSEGSLGAVQRRMSAAIVAALIGVFILFGVGLAHPDLIHNAAHDARHAFSFPCH